MAATPSNMVPLGTKAPAFELYDTVSDSMKSLEQLGKGPATVIMFICNHCPYVKHLNKGLVGMAHDYLPKGVSFVAISANDAVKYPADAPSKMKETAVAEGYPFPYLYDETQAVARAYEAACTPDFYLFDKDLALVYRGQFDSSRPGNGLPVTGSDLRHALDCVLAGTPVPENQTPSIGCNIKWKA